jgi:CRP/FNR family transcriptional regulator, anaerobic regulatory protein
MHAHKIQLLTSEPPCSGCRAEPFCLQSAFSGERLRDFKQAIHVRGPYQRGETIYREGLPFTSLYFIQKGSVKTEVCTVNGMLEVTAFYLIGELLGVDSIGSECYPSDAVAMEETWLCQLSHSQLKSMCQDCDEFQQALIARLGRTINTDVYQWALARNLKAKQKVAWFIFNLFERIRSRQTIDMRVIPLPMRKTDIANYLGLAPESLSRALHALEKEGVIVNQSKQIFLSDIQQAQLMSMI